MQRFHPIDTDLSAGPPPEVLAEIDAAWERAREMFESDLELHFEVDRELGRVWAELRLPDGEVVEELSATEALALACGDTQPALALVA